MGTNMEQVPNWLIDAVAAAGLATAYSHQYDALIEEGPRKAGDPTEDPVAH
jgi:hypothetical protein